MDAAAALPLLTDPLSPELVLVSPPEVARMARILLSPKPVARPATVSARPPQAGLVELSAVWLFCLAMTLGPVLFMIAVQ